MKPPIKIKRRRINWPAAVALALILVGLIITVCFLLNECFKYLGK